MARISCVVSCNSYISWIVFRVAVKAIHETHELHEFTNKTRFSVSDRYASIRAAEGNVLRGPSPTYDD